MTELASFRAALGRLPGNATAMQKLHALIEQRLDRLPLPGAGATIDRWRRLAEVAAHDLSLAKLFEGHTDALAVLHELARQDLCVEGRVWGMWAAEPPAARTVMRNVSDARVTLHGRKAWCSGADSVSHGLLTTWGEERAGSQLAVIAMSQPTIEIDRTHWQAVGMAESSSLDLLFNGAHAERVGPVDAYLHRPGFWHGGAGVAACWYGASVAIAEHLKQSMASAPGQSSPFRAAALGMVDLSLRRVATVLREAAGWIDAHPQADAQAVALRARLAADGGATEVLSLVGKALGASPFCRDLRFARLAADLPVFIRQSHAERDFAALGDRIAADGAEWSL